MVVAAVLATGLFCMYMMPIKDVIFHHGVQCMIINSDDI